MKVMQWTALDSDEENIMDVVVMVEEEDDLKLGRRLYITQIHETRKEKRKYQQTAENKTTTNTKYPHFHSFINIFKFHRSKQGKKSDALGLKRRHIQSQSVATSMKLQDAD
jgi:hypothetical protein